MANGATPSWTQLRRIDSALANLVRVEIPAELSAGGSIG